MRDSEAIVIDQDTLHRLREDLERDREQQRTVLLEHGADPDDASVAHLQIGNDGFADSAQATEERSELLSHIEAARDRLMRLEDALTRMDAGTYGACANCGRAIPVARLEVLPLAVQCVDCAATNP